MLRLARRALHAVIGHDKIVTHRTGRVECRSCGHVLPQRRSY